MGTQFMVKVVAWIPLFNAVFLAVMATICSTLAYNKGTVSVYLPSISETGSTTPSLYFFMLGTMFSSISVAIIIVYKYLILRYYIGSGKKQLRLFNTCTCAIGLLSTFALLIITPFPLSENRVAHTSIAITHFILCMCYSCLSTFVSGRAHPSRRMHILRMCLCISHATLGVLFIALYPVARHLFIKNNPLQGEDLKEPGDEMFGFFFVACLFEWLMYTAYIFYLLTFIPEFLRFRLVLEAEPSRDVEIASHDKPSGDRDVEIASHDKPSGDPDVTDEVTQSETTPPVEDGGSESAETETKSV